MVQHGNEEYLSPEEAAGLLGVSRRTLERYAREAGITRYRTRVKKFVYRKVDIERMLEPRPETDEDIKPEE